MGTAAVVGAGIGGLATAIALRRDGWDVTVFERWPRIVELGTAIGLWPDAQRTLDRLGLGERIRAVGVPYRQGAVRTRRGWRIARLPLKRIEKHGGAPVLMVPRTTLITTLADAIPSDVVRTGVTITDPDRLRRDHDLVVGADGYRSIVRDAFFPGVRARYLGVVAVRGVVDGEFGPAGEVWGRGALVGVTPVERGRTNWYVALRAPTGTKPTVADLRELCADYPDPIPAVLAAATDESLLRHDVHDLAPAPASYVHGTIALVGDAAHAMAPSLGQGACQALVDADCLATELTNAPDVTTALRSYDHLRRRPTQRLARASRLLSRVQA
ncbi:FAD-dependent monooxygenase [Cryptosporangium aurantiacum]|uniref:2-polyprenyl-6-methoxyphenol hydroxylase n=1 Tax=Cryptosporangium aurantiacum TaxID=134849 RepID=A0A1M7REB2_9ACTN|nr:FAD-dependent monooxygenase [Cryptosporangium aurantiacum]SHN44615.1 2-polyprenyl-6-methoxyphenol hydroxylase [Cryptosporangium aurantiacum]